MVILRDFHSAISRKFANFRNQILNYFKWNLARVLKIGVTHQHKLAVILYNQSKFSNFDKDLYRIFRRLRKP